MKRGHPVYIRGLPPAATEAVVENIFAEFGPIKQGEGGVVIKDVKGVVAGYRFGVVTFQDLISKKKAIEKSPVNICEVKVGVEEIRRTGDDYLSFLSKEGGYPCIVSGGGSVKAPGSSTMLSIPPTVDTPGGPAPAHASPLSGSAHDSPATRREETNMLSGSSTGGLPTASYSQIATGRISSNAQGASHVKPVEAKADENVRKRGKKARPKQIVYDYDAQDHKG